MAMTHSTVQQLEAVGTPREHLETMATMPGFDWSKLPAVIAALLALFGITVPTGASIAEMHAAATAKGIDWGKFFGVLLSVLPTILAGLKPTA